MGNRMKFAVWFRDGRLFRVRPPGWPKNTELSFTDKQDMVEWARGAHVMLKDGDAGRKYA